MPVKKNKNTKFSVLGEFGFIDLIKKNVSLGSSVITGIGDDTAVVSVSKSKKTLLTTDMLVEGVHFTKDMPLWGIGHKALACSISDIAAMGGVPKHALVSVGIPVFLSWKFMYQVYQAMEATAAKFGVSIVGGDTVKADKIIINVALTGEAKSEDIIFRSGAKPKDKIFVTGSLGNSLKNEKHLRFVPRIKESKYLVKNFKPSSMTDISDGLIADLGHILKESKVGALIYENSIPFAEGAGINNALHDGEDFELIFTLSPEKAEELKKTKSPFKFSQVGEITASKGRCLMLDKRGKKRSVLDKGYVHF
ncbi:MAG: thiamine-phosphate kinase [Candidatus Zapsychrus exili]|nr:thiamine-phosphate kinase [Candidatus Zapsychrus exili]